MMMMTSSLALAVGLLASLVAAEYPTHAESAHGAAGGAYPSGGGAYPAYGAAGGAYPAYGGAGGAYPSGGGAYPAYGAVGGAYPSGGAHGSGDGAYPAYAGAGGAYPAYAGGAGGGYYPAYTGHIEEHVASVPTANPSTELNKLFARLGDLNAEIYILGNDIDKLKIRNMLVSRSVENVLIKGAASRAAISSLQNDITNVGMALGAIETQLGAITSSNLDEQESNLQSKLELEANRLNSAAVEDSADAGDIAAIGTKLAAAKGFVNWDMDTENKIYFQRLQQIRDQLDAELVNMNREICESGTVSIFRDDPRVEVLFTSDFGSDIPHTTYGISGYEFDLRAKHDKSHVGRGAYSGNPGGHGGYGGAPTSYGFSYEPNALGVFVNQMTTNKGITFDAVNLGFGQSDLLRVRVSYQTCNVGNSPDVYQPIG